MPFRRRHVEHRLAILRAGVGDKDVDGHAALAQARDGLRDGVLVGDVEGFGQRFDAEALQGGSRFGAARRIPAVDDDPRAGLAESFANGAPEPARPAGDEGGTALEREHFLEPLRLHGLLRVRGTP